jgi:predicted ferric reductase/Ca2+-binding EF-hand superfamily protein
MAPTPSPPWVDTQLIAALEKAFVKHAGADGVIDVKELQRALGLRTEYLARRVLVSLDLNRDGVLSRDEFIAGVKKLVFGSDKEKLEFAFRMHDHDGDGFIDRLELLRMITMSLGESDLTTRESTPPEKLTHALLTTADTNGDGRISFAEFDAVVRKRPELLDKMTRSEALWIAPSEDLLARLDSPAKKERRVARFFENEWPETIFVFLWLAALVFLFWRSMFAGVPERTHFLVQLGRATGKCMDLCAALVFVPVTRRLLTKLRATRLHRLVPVDEAIRFHKVLGHTLFGLGVVHVASFVGAYAQGHPNVVNVLTTARGATGTALFVVFAIMWGFALGTIRRSSRFELFYFTHLLYVAWVAIAIAHAPSILVWLGLPLLGFGIEQIVRLRRRGRETSVIAARALRSGVTRLDIRRPEGFAQRAGDYAFLRIPSIAKHEWHPFTISSAPENDALTVHVRSLGNWTSNLRRRVEADEKNPRPAPMTVFVDGPYGSPSAHIFESRFAVFIGAGIGVTPFASILESLVRRAHGDRPPTLEKAHFFWLNRDQYSFEWFVSLLTEIERIDQKGLLDVHLCMTGGRTGGTAVALEIAREILHAAGDRDIVTGLRTKTHMGHPAWEVVLGAIAEQHAPAQVDVYFCGPRGLAAKLRPISGKLGMRFREELF